MNELIIKRMLHHFVASYFYKYWTLQGNQQLSLLREWANSLKIFLFFCSKLLYELWTFVQRNCCSFGSMPGGGTDWLTDVSSSTTMFRLTPRLPAFTASCQVQYYNQASSSSRMWCWSNAGSFFRQNLLANDLINYLIPWFIIPFSVCLLLALLVLMLLVS